MPEPDNPETFMNVLAENSLAIINFAPGVAVAVSVDHTGDREGADWTLRVVTRRSSAGVPRGYEVNMELDTISAVAVGTLDDLERKGPEVLRERWRALDDERRNAILQAMGERP